MSPHRIAVMAGSAVVLGVAVLGPSAAWAQGEPAIDTGWDVAAIDIKAALDDPAAVPDVGISPVLIAPGAQGAPERSPDGTRLAYTSVDAASVDWPSVQIYVLEVDGTRRRLTDHDAGATEPTWSPDGERIAFVSGSGGIYSIAADGTGQRQVVGVPDASAPDWSPDGRHIVFQRGGEDGGEIWSVNVRTGRSKRLTHSEIPRVGCEGPGKPVQELRDPARVYARLPVCEYLSRDPAWSPDGAWIAFMRHEDMWGGHLEFEDTDLWLMRPDGSRKHRAVSGEDEPIAMPGFESPDGHFQGAPAWSPDGRRIALTGGHCECLLIVDVGTGTPRELGHGAIDGIDGDLDWAPDGTILASWADPSSSVWDVD